MFCFFYIVIKIQVVRFSNYCILHCISHSVPTFLELGGLDLLQMREISIYVKVHKHLVANATVTKMRG